MKETVLNGHALTVLEGDCYELLKTLPNNSINCCVTSPPYWGLRDYGHAGQLGLERTPQEYVDRMTEIFREVRRVLRGDGTLWLNLGDSYAGSWGNYVAPGSTSAKALDKRRKDRYGTFKPPMADRSGKSGNKGNKAANGNQSHRFGCGLPPGKNLIGIPWRVAFALQADGWYLRSDIIWHKPNPMPESVKDRPTTAHEHVFLLAKTETYYYDQEAILEPCSASTHARLSQNVQKQIGSARSNGGAKTNGNMKAVARKSWHGSQFHDGKNAVVHPNIGKNRIKDNLSMDSALAIMPEFRNRHTVWRVPTCGFREAHFATYPPDLVKPCIFAGCPPGGIVLDPFAGSGTTGMVALELGRRAVLCELNPEYVKLINQRTNVTPGLELAKPSEVAA